MHSVLEQGQAFSPILECQCSWHVVVEEHGASSQTKQVNGIGSRFALLMEMISGNDIGNFADF